MHSFEITLVQCLRPSPRESIRGHNESILLDVVRLPERKEDMPCFAESVQPAFRKSPGTNPQSPGPPRNTPVRLITFNSPKGVPGPYAGVMKTLVSKEGSAATAPKRFETAGITACTRFTGEGAKHEEFPGIKTAV